MGRRAVFSGAVALAVAALAATGAMASSPAPLQTALQPTPVAAAGAGSYTWTHTDQAGQVVFTRSGPLAAGQSFEDGAVSGTPARGGAGELVGTTACCSASGCDTVDVARTLQDWFGLQTLARFHHRVYWCWSAPKITGVSVSCYATDLSGVLGVLYFGCGGSGNYYTWSGSTQGGHYSFRQGDFQQCLLKIGCGSHRYPWVKIWVNGNGAWTQDQGG